MNTQTTTGTQPSATCRCQRHDTSKPDIAAPGLLRPSRGERGPTPLVELLEPLQRIIRHPNRNRLLAEFFDER